MVHKIIWALIVSELLHGGGWAFGQERKLSFNWATTGKVSSSNCIHLVEVFLGELRTIASDFVIELGANEDAPIQLRCTGLETIEVRGKNEEDAISMRFQSLSQSFDSLDWVEFQKRFASGTPTLSALAPQQSSGSAPSMESRITLAEETASSSPIYKKWWFWALVGGVGIGAYAGSKALTGSRSMNVEIH